jgi:hypothetical protein
VKEEIANPVILEERFTNITAHSPGGELSANLTVEGDMHRIELRNAGLYGIVSLSNETV